MELSSTAYVILGMLSRRPMSGYEIKAAVDNSTRFFWAASYGQIYPELRQLADAGLVEGQADPQSGRKRTTYRLTASGRRELRRWLAEPPEAFELRDEGLLKLFFAGAQPDAAAAALAAKRRYHEGVAERLREIERAVQADSRSEQFPSLVLRYGIECNEWTANWCERAQREIESRAAKEERSAA
jgi:PadR family transcriptional regulator AphA